MATPVLILQQTIIQVLQDFLEFLGPDPDADAYLAIDKDNHHYLLIETGWQNDRRIYGTLIHIDIIGEKVWIQHDGTETGIANELTDLDIPKDQIVLAYKSPERRKITDFAVS
ncbi:XisI protein [Romeria aff. gracilis LEGE 07310]|uniref:XisI protein n=1 Tax=Vasconcelosia minhoensis LEGE 07310 TaxID=915328 RepID=A0A8J7AIN7_9CYAN|nr:XisI protein [Romeria gracilis]MBE9078283.1 XisI protein [Romeria aff. gracilis LEGE 07310]